MTELWQPALVRADSWVSPALSYAHIDGGCNNGIRCRSVDADRAQDFAPASSPPLSPPPPSPPLTRGAELIVEAAFVCSVSAETRERGVRFCSLCGCFLGGDSSVRDEIERLVAMAAAAPATTAEHVTPFPSALVDALAGAVDATVADTGMSEHPLWFAVCDPRWPGLRCGHCSAGGGRRCLNPAWPQTLDECSFFLQTRTAAVDPGGVLPLNSAAELVKIALEYDEGVLSVARVVFMLLDEVVASCGAHDMDCDVTHDDHQRHRNINNESRMMMRALDRKIDTMCACFDEGVMPGADRGQTAVWRACCGLLNDVVDRVVSTMLPHLAQCRALPCAVADRADDVAVVDFEGRVGDDDHPQRCWLSLQQFFTIRCVLQTNQHRAVVAHPLAALLAVVGRRHAEVAPDAMTAGDDAPADSALAPLRDLVAGLCATEISIQAAALFLNVSRFNHSCAPNAHVEPSLNRRGASVRVVALADVIEPGTEIRISYVNAEDIARDKAAAHRHLKKHYGFDCQD